ncbi:MAG: type VII toxin-antitoxin system HepT family RNase toxin [Thermodesulfobacteriota bacterium]
MERIVQKTGRIREYLDQIQSMRQDCEKRFETDPIYRGAMLHYLYLLTDTCITLAAMVIKQKKLRLPQSYQESFDILGDNQILEPGFAHDFAKIAGFRNFLAHDYENVNKAIICRNILSQMEKISNYLEQIEKNLGLQRNNENSFKK